MLNFYLSTTKEFVLRLVEIKGISRVTIHFCNVRYFIRQKSAPGWLNFFGNEEDGPRRVTEYSWEACRTKSFTPGYKILNGAGAEDRKINQTASDSHVAMIQENDKSERTDISTSAEILSISYRLPAHVLLRPFLSPLRDKACDEHLTTTKPRLHRRVSSADTGCSFFRSIIPRFIPIFFFFFVKLSTTF